MSWTRRARCARRKPSSGRLRRAPLLLFLWVTLNYSWTLPLGFTDDDYIWVYGASAAAEKPATIFAPPGFGGGFLRPLVQASFVANHGLGGVHAAGYRALNLLGHAAAAILVWVVWSRLLGPGWIALVAAAAFAVHPSCAQTVVWISGRTEVLCGVFYLAAVSMHLRGARAGAAVAFALALASKESALSLPLLLAGLELLRRPRPGAASLAALWPYALVAALYLAARALLLDEFAAASFGSGDAAGAVAFARTKITLIAAYLLAPIPVHGFVRALVLLGGGALLALGLTRRASEPERGAVRVGIAWAAVTLLPYLPWFAFLPWYVYLASMGGALAITGFGAFALRRLGATRGLAGVAAALWLGASALMLQVNIAREARAAARTEAVVAALEEAMVGTRTDVLVVIDGLQGDVLGAGPVTPGRPLLAYGLTEALRLRTGSDFLHVEHGDRTHAGLRAFQRPVLYLEWSEEAQVFRPQWRSFEPG